MRGRHGIKAPGLRWGIRAFRVLRRLPSFGPCQIIGNKQDATDNLFRMAQRYHENCPEEVRPHTARSSARELFFDTLDSGYHVGTAGSKADGYHFHTQGL